MNSAFLLDIVLDGLFAAIAAVGFAVISNPPRRTIPYTALLAAIGHAMRFWMLDIPVSITAASFAGAFSIGLLALLFARRLHCPAEVLSFPALLPMIPGMYAYKTILTTIQFMSDKTPPEEQQFLLTAVFHNGFTTLFVMSALVIGVLLPILMFPKVAYTMTRLLKPIVGK